MNLKSLIARASDAHIAASAKAYVKSTAALSSLMASSYALALDKVDLTTDTSGGKTFDDIAANIDNAGKSGAAAIIGLVAIGGYVVVAISLYSLWKASKDQREEKPMSAIAGLFIGGAMAAVATIMWIMKNTVVGTTK
jgi:hypothetical protein